MLNKIKVHLAGIATFAFLSVLFTTNVFAQWQPEVRLTTDTNYSATAGNNAWCIAASGNTVHVVWVDAVYGGTYSAIYYKRSTDGGISWGSNMLLAGGTHTPYNPSVAVSGSVVHVVWTEDPAYPVEEIHYRRSTDGGNSWELAVAINANGVSTNPSVTASGSNVVVVWQEDIPDNNYEIFSRCSTTGGASWGSVTRLTDAPYGSSSPVAAVSGLIVNVVWSDERDAVGSESEIYLKRSTNGGASWGADTRLTNATGLSWYPSITAVGSIVHLLWEDRRNGNNSPDIYYKRSLDGGVNWGTDIRINNTGNAGKPSVSGYGQSVHVVWEDSPDFNVDVYHRFSTNSGVNWQPATRLTFDTTYQRNASVSISGSVVHTVWEDSRHSPLNTEIYYRRNPTSGAIFVTSPQAGELVLSGAPYEIRWTGPGIDSLRIEFSSDSGSTYQELERSFPASSGHYVWVPSDGVPSTKCVIKLTDKQNAANTATSALFKVKGYVLTRYKQNGDFEIFDPSVHGWRFGNDSASLWPQQWWSQFNYQQGIDPYTHRQYPLLFGGGVVPPKKFVDWPLFVRSFDTSQCYANTLSAWYKALAIRLWTASYKWGGSCLGFAVSSLMAFDDKAMFLNRFPEVGAFQNLYDLPLNDVRREVVNHLWVQQFGIKHSASASENDQVRVTLQKLKDMFLSEVRDDAWIRILSGTSFVHAVVPISLERLDGPGRFWLYTYDSNYPYQSPRIFLDSLNQEWVSEVYNIRRNDGYGLDLVEPASSYYTRDSLWHEPSAIIAATLTAAEPVRFFATQNAFVSISNSFGNIIGFRDSVVFNNITGASPIQMATGGYSPPIGFYVPSGNYSVVMDSIPDTIATISAIEGSRMFTVWRGGVTIGQTERVALRNGIETRNTDPATKIMNFESIAGHASGERLFRILNCAAVLNDSMRMGAPDSNQLKFVNWGTQKTYDLDIGLSARTERGIFRHSTIAVPANSAHTIVPNWQNLQQPIRIYVDLGNNGTIDDSMFVNNQTTDMRGELTPEIPREFKLEQNYPNPFNPSTNIVYSIPENGFVALKVFDLLGEEVATLVNEPMQSGTYSVQFDAKNLSSGTYFYRLQTEKFTDTKRMLYLK